MVKTVKVPPRSEMEIMACLDTTVEVIWLLQEAVNQRVPAAVPCALVEPSTTAVPVRMMNPKGELVTVYAGMTVATLERVKPLMGGVADVSETDQDPEQTVGVEKQGMLWDLVQKSGQDLSPEEKEMFHYLLLSYADAFACFTADLGRTDKLVHHIHTGDARLVRQPVRRIPPQRRGEVHKLLNEMLERGVIEPSTSPWASPIVLVQKNDGTTRFCVDYRKQNNVTGKDAYPLPSIDATLDTLHRSKWFTTLDLLSGYWQVEMDETDRQKTAFCKTEGLFQFKVMPFGLCNAPATFQRLMDLVLAGLQWSDCLVYLDDVIVLERTFVEHLRNLQSVLQ